MTHLILQTDTIETKSYVHLYCHVTKTLRASHCRRPVVRCAHYAEATHSYPEDILGDEDGSALTCSTT
jgi:hypothetical protein